MTTETLGRATHSLLPTLTPSPEGCVDGINERNSGDKSFLGLTCTGTCGDCETGLAHEPMPPVDQMRPLEDVMKFDNVHIVRRIAKEQKLELHEAQQLFKDMLVFLYICAANRTDFRYSPPVLIDEAWHTFIVYTESYTAFCRRNFGFYLHHRPFTETEEVQKPTTGTLVLLVPEARRRIGTLSRFWFER